MTFIKPTLYFLFLMIFFSSYSISFSQETSQHDNINSPANHHEWKKYFKPDGSLTFKGVDPLLTTYWAQACYYNDSCPEDPNGSCGHAKAGCGATALSQILKYFNYPVNGIGSHSFYHPTYGIISADFENTFYDWNNMPDVLSASSLPEEVAAVAQLMFHCGVAVEMDYAYNASFSGTTSLRNAFFDFFGYSSKAQLLNKSHFPDSLWKVMMRAEIDAQRPVFYCISSGSGGHFIVLDGYSDDGHFHFNWGNGVASGYDKLLSELPTVQEAIIGIQPNPDVNDPSAVFLARFCRFDDGSSILDYQPNTSCQYLVNPPGADSIALFFSGFNTESGYDFLRVYDGDSLSSPLLGEFSGTNLPPHFVSGSGKMLLEFTSNDTISDTGWQVSYSASIPGVTSGLQVITDSTGIFNDGSGSGNYLSHIDVYRLIQPPGATTISISFNSFNTEFSCDYLRVYNGDNTSPDNLLGVFSGTSLPPDLTAYSGKMLLHFNTDFSTTRPGWEVNFTSTFEKIYLDLKVFLEGPFNGSDMNTNLNPDYLPLQQPFNIHPWNYYGSEDIQSVPNGDIVEWLLIELRETIYGADSAISESVIAQKPAFLLKDGTVCNLNGSSLLEFNKIINHNLFVVIYHRNHLAIMSANPLIESGGTYTYDFTTSSSQAYGVTAQKELTPGIWGMVAGDGNGSGLIDTADKVNPWETQAGEKGYYPGDFNLDTQVDNKDKDDFWLPNEWKGCQVPE